MKSRSVISTAHLKTDKTLRSPIIDIVMTLESYLEKPCSECPFTPPTCGPAGNE